MAVASWLATARKPYRELRDDYMKAQHVSLEAGSEQAWLATMIQVEKALYPKLVARFNWKRRWLLLMQWTAVIQVLLLGVITVLGSWGK